MAARSDGDSCRGSEVWLDRACLNKTTVIPYRFVAGVLRCGELISLYVAIIWGKDYCGFEDHRSQMSNSEQGQLEVSKGFCKQDVPGLSVQGLNLMCEVLLFMCCFY